MKIERRRTNRQVSNDGEFLSNNAHNRCLAFIEIDKKTRNQNEYIVFVYVLFANARFVILGLLNSLFVYVCVCVSFLCVICLQTSFHTEEK
jgi:hypothetical protein